MKMDVCRLKAALFCPTHTLHLNLYAALAAAASALIVVVVVIVVGSEMFKMRRLTNR